MLKRYFVWTVVIGPVGFLGAPAFAGESVIDLTSGTTGTMFFNQSFNETRGVNVTVLGSDLQVTSMTLAEFNIAAPPATVGARVYSNTGSLLASADQSVGSGFNQSVTIPISALLQQGSTYRLAFFIEAANFGGSGDFFDPDPPGVTVTPYVDDTGSVQITQAFAFPADVFPTNLNFFVPLITVTLAACPIDLDGDGFVGVTDLLVLLAGWGTNPGHPADFNSDRQVGVEDLLALLAAWGPCT